MKQVKADKDDLIVYLCIAGLISYLVIKTGMVSDDFFNLAWFLNLGPLKPAFINPGLFFITRPVFYFTHMLWFSFFHPDSLFLFDLLKIFYIILSFYLTSRFFRIFMNRQNAFLISFFFIFFPSHDTTVYSFSMQYLTLSFAFYFYSFYLAYHDRLVMSSLLAAAASFVSYGSPVIASALFVLFAIDREWKKGLVMLVPNMIYSAYYLFMSEIAGYGYAKIALSLGAEELKSWSVVSVAKLFILQIITFIDAALGPSLWLKVYYSFFQLSLPSIMIGALLTAVFYKKMRASGEPLNKKLVISFLVLAFLSFGLFSITGLYPQLAFNLGNRVTIFGSLLIAYAFILLPASRVGKTVLFSVMIFSVLGISDHWKSWNSHQQEIIGNIANNEELKNDKNGQTIYVSGNQYSKFGPISHIEFLSEGWVAESVFKIALEKDILVKPLNKRFHYRDGFLIDRKYHRKKKVGDTISIYDSEKNENFLLDTGKINDYTDSLLPENRHWTQMLPDGFIRNTILYLSPRLRYAF